MGSTSKFYVYGGGRWREVEYSDGHASGWGRVRFATLRCGKLHLLRRTRVLAALNNDSALLGPSLPRKRSKLTQTDPFPVNSCQHGANMRDALVNLPSRVDSMTTKEVCLQMSLTPVASAPAPHLTFIQNNKYNTSPSSTGSAASLVLDITPPPTTPQKRGTKRKLSETKETKNTSRARETVRKGPTLRSNTSPSSTGSAASLVLDITPPPTTPQKRGTKRKLSETKETKNTSRARETIRKGPTLRSNTSPSSTGSAASLVLDITPPPTTPQKRGTKRKLSETKETKNTSRARETVRKGPTLRSIVYSVSSDSDEPLVKRKKTTVKPNIKKIDSKKVSKSKECGKKLMILEQDVAIMRSYLSRTYAGFDKRRYDKDAAYRSLFLYSYNPLVSIERCRDTDRLLEQREVTSVEMFASRLGLRRSTSQASASAFTRTPPHCPSTPTPNRRSLRVSRSLPDLPFTSSLPRRTTRARALAQQGPATDVISIASTDSDMNASRKRDASGHIFKPNAKQTVTIKFSNDIIAKTMAEQNSKNKLKKDDCDESKQKEDACDDNKQKKDACEDNKQNEDKTEANLNKAKRATRDGSKNECNIKNKSDRPKKEYNLNNNRPKKGSTIKKTNSKTAVASKDPYKQVNPKINKELNRIEKSSDDLQNVQYNPNNRKSTEVISNNNINKVLTNKDATSQIKTSLENNVRRQAWRVKELKRRNIGSLNKEYSRSEDQTIVAWILTGNRAQLVNGNRVWRDLEQHFPSLTGTTRSWHSLRNRYLRYLLPSLGSLALPQRQQQKLRVAAARGEIKKRNNPASRNSIFGAVERGAFSRVPTVRPPPASPPLPPVRTRRSLRSEVMRHRKSSPASPSSVSASTSRAKASSSRAPESSPRASASSSRASESNTRATASSSRRR